MHTIASCLKHSANAICRIMHAESKREFGTRVKHMFHVLSRAQVTPLTVMVCQPCRGRTLDTNHAHAEGESMACGLSVLIVALHDRQLSAYLQA